MRSIASGQFRIGQQDVCRAIAALLQPYRLPGGQAEEEEVLRPRFLADLDVGAVQRADGERPVSS